jgi:hypothetical protein
MVLRLALVCVAAVLFALGALAAETAPPRYAKIVVLPEDPLLIKSRLVPTESPIVRPFSYELLPIWSGGKNVFAALPNYEPGTARTVYLVAPVSSDKRSKAD